MENHKHSSKGTNCCSLPIFNLLVSALEKKGFEDPVQHLVSLMDGLMESADTTSSAPGSKIFHNGIIRPMTSGDATVTVEAIATDGSDIIASGTLDDCRKAASNAEIIDLRGRTLLPGFIDSHVHLLTTAVVKMFIWVFRVEGERLADVYTLETCYEKMRSVLAGRRRRGRSGADSWIIAVGLDPPVFTDTKPGDWRDPTADDLDKNISDEVPVVIFNASFHFAYANTKAMERTGMFRENGVFVEDQVFELAGPIFLEICQERPLRFVLKCLQGLRDLLNDAACKGITLMWDAMLGTTFSRLELDFLNFLAEKSIMPVRFGGALKVLTKDHLRMWKDAGVTPDTFKSETFRVPCVKLTADASAQGLTAFMHDKYPYPNPYINNEFPYGIWNFENQDFPSLVKAIDNDGWSLMIHCNGNHGMDRVLEAIAALNAGNRAAKQKRHRTEHTTYLTDDAIKRFVENGLSPSFLIGHVGYWGYAYKTKIFPKLAPLVVRTRSCVDAGLRITLHSDMAVSPLGAVRMVEQSVTRTMEADPAEGVLSPTEKLTMAQALRAVTYDAAWQCHMDDVCGELVVGKKADFVILHKDPMSVDDAAGLREHVKVSETWMNGKLVYDDGES